MLLKILDVLNNHFISKMDFVIGRHYSAQNIEFLFLAYSICYLIQAAACKHDISLHNPVWVRKNFWVKELKAEILYNFIVAFNQIRAPGINYFLFHFGR